MLFNLVALAVFVAGAFGYASFVPSEWVNQYGPALVATINLFLRYITTEPVKPLV